MKKIDPVRILKFATASLPFINPLHFYPDGDAPSQLIAVLLAACLAFALYRRGEKPRLSALSLTLAYLSAFLIINLGSDNKSSTALITILPAILISLTNEKDTTPILWGIVFGALINAFAGYAQLTNETTDLGGLIFRDPSISEVTIYGNIAQRNLFATYLFIGFLAAAQLHSQRKPSFPISAALFLFSIFIIPPLTFSASRTTVLYTLLTLLFLLLANHKTRTSRYTKKFSIFTLIFISLMTACQITPQELIPYKNGLRRASESESIRIAEWKKTYQIISENFPFGIGWGNYPHYSFLEQIKASSAAKNLTWTHSHNIFLNLLCELGVAAIPLILLISYLAFTIIRSSIRKKENYFSSLAIVTLGVHSLLEYPLWYAHFFILSVLIINSHQQKKNEIVISKTSQTLILCSTAAVIIGCSITISQYKYLAGSTFKSIDPLENIERASKFNVIAANPYLSFAAELSLLNHLPVGSGSMRLCLLEKLTKKLPTYTLLDKFAIELYVEDEEKIARSVLNSRFKAYPTESDFVLLDDTRGFPAKKQKLIEIDIENAKAGSKGEDLYQLKDLPSCR